MYKLYLTFTVLAIASLIGGIHTSCSSPSQSQTQNTSTTDAGSKPVQGHSNAMNHSMAMDLGSADADYDLRLLMG